MRRILLLVLFLSFLSARSSAQGQVPGNLWQGDQVIWHAAEPREWSSWPLAAIGGVQMPARLVVSERDTVHVDLLASGPWLQPLAAAAVAVPRTSTGQLRPDLGPTQVPRLPAAPVVLLRQSHVAGRMLYVWALVPWFQEHGQIRVVRDLEARLLAGALSTAAAKWPPGPAPANPAAAQASWTIRVAQAGLQELTADALFGQGVPVTVNPHRLHLQLRGQEVALDWHLAQPNRLQAGDFVRWYAAAPGDRWNSTTTDWLTLAATPGPVMTSIPAGATQGATAAVQVGRWRQPQIYDSTLPGPHGDHWFAADLRTGPGQPAATFDVTLQPTLPLISAGGTITLTGTAYTAGLHQLQITMGGQLQALSWTGTGDWQQVLAIKGDTAVHLALLPGSAADGVELDDIRWQLPVRTDTDGHGVDLNSTADALCLSQVASGSSLYDVQDVLNPVVLGAGTPCWQTRAGHLLALSGAGETVHPVLAKHPAVQLGLPMQADEIMILPAAWQPALAPLVRRRQQQGWLVLQIDPQDIYDAWSFGQVDPEALRSFLRWTATWNRLPHAVLLVGDGTSDPLNYSGRNNANILPPYLAMVDPELGETACEPCYVQLQGDSSLGDALPQLMVGRLPAKSADEAAHLSAKLLSYELAPPGAWTSRELYVADNADSAGDFAALSDASAAAQPAGVMIQRMYYDPTSSSTSSREPDAARAYQRTLDDWNTGNGIVNYTGHSHYFQWASTDPAANPSYLLGLYDPDQLTNSQQLSVVLEMTCLTAAFQEPAYSGTTIDERLLLANGGAVAVWGPTGLGLVGGHAQLQAGFDDALWSAASPPVIGSLVQAGFARLFTQGTCCQDALRTFALLGDPLMPVRAQAAHRIFLPLVRR